MRCLKQLVRHKSEGWPVWQGTFLPFGQEWNPQITTNHYKPGPPAKRFPLLGWKFTGDEHDSESNLEHTQFRQLSSVEGRWLSPESGSPATLWSLLG